MEQRIGWRAPPNRCGHRADHQLHPDARQGDDQPLITRGLYRAFGRVGIKRRGQVDQRKAHGRDARAVMFTGVRVRIFMEGHHHHSEDIQHRHVAPRFVREIVELHGVAPDFRPVADGQPGRERKRQERQYREPGRINPHRPAVQAGNKLVRVERGEQNHGDIRVSALYLQRFLPVFGALLHQQDVSFLRGLIPEVRRFQFASEFPNLLGVVLHAVLRGIKRGNLLIGALTVEKPDQAPIFFGQRIHQPGARGINAHHQLAVLEVLLEGDVGVQARVTLRQRARWNFRKRYVEGLVEIHRIFSAWRPGARWRSSRGASPRARLAIPPGHRTCRWRDPPPDLLL